MFDLRYVEKLRKLKVKKGKRKVAGVDPLSEEQSDWEVHATAATKALGLRWLRMARENVEKKHKEKGDRLREDLKNNLMKVKEEDDWFFGAEFRLEGEALLRAGQDLRDDQRNLNAEIAVKVRKIEIDFEQFEKEKQVDINHDRAKFESTIAEYNANFGAATQNRIAELERYRENKRLEFQMEEKKAREELGAASTEMQEAHRKALYDIDDQLRDEQQNAEEKRAAFEADKRLVYDQKEALQIQVS